MRNATRTWIVLGAAGLLGGGVAVGSHGGVIGSCDDDGVPDYVDNCVCTPNGPAASTYSCDTQLDGDMDGYGNPCDTDLDNDGGTSLTDVNLIFQAASILDPNPAYDIDCDGGPSLADVNLVFNDAAIVAQPGPSGLACAGSIPCP